jgi:NTE family protein
MTDSITPTKSGRGYVRGDELQTQFSEAANQLREHDGWRGPDGNSDPQLVADLALEGGGVKGIGLVGAVLVLDEAGYSFRGVAGTSAGAIAASLIAALSVTRPDDMVDLREFMQSLTFSDFMPNGWLHRLFDVLGSAGNAVADATILTHKMGIYSGDYLNQWLGSILYEKIGISTFGELQLLPDVHPRLGGTPRSNLQALLDADPEISLPDGQNYRLVVHTADITRGELVRFPWDYPVYGHKAEDEDIVKAVRASMSIPFFFEPVRFDSINGAELTVPLPSGGVTRVKYEDGTVTLVDGGMLRNFPITAFDRIDGGPPRWPTIGIKLSNLRREYKETKASRCTAQVAIRCLETMMSEWDAYSIDAATAGRTIFVDNDGIGPTDFDLGHC